MMRHIILFCIVSLSAGLPSSRLSPKFQSTPMSRGGGRIVGGTEAEPGEFPFLVMILRGGVGGSLMCGGSLVSPNKVVTAGHCCDGYTPVLAQTEYEFTLLSIIGRRRGKEFCVNIYLPTD